MKPHTNTKLTEEVYVVDKSTNQVVVKFRKMGSARNFIYQNNKSYFNELIIVGREEWENQK